MPSERLGPSELGHSPGPTPVGVSDSGHRSGTVAQRGTILRVFRIAPAAKELDVVGYHINLAPPIAPFLKGGT